MTAQPTGKRMGGLAFVAVLAFGVLLSRLWFLQIMSAPEYQALTSGNRTREVYVEAPRGRIIDAKGRILADRRESLVVTLDWVMLQDEDSSVRSEVFEQVADILNSEGIKAKLSSLEEDYMRAKRGSLKPVVVAEDIDVRTWLTISESDLVGFAVERRWVRSYPYGSIGAHIIGYTGTVTGNDEAEALNSDDGSQHYLAGDEIGVAGLEKTFESTLRGTPEHRRVEVDALNRIVRTAEVLQEAELGQDIYLTIDIDLQYAAELILEDELQEARRRDACKTCELPHVGQAGSLVALDVTDGSVIALASYPTFDPADFVFGISSEQFSFLREREDQPLFDRATRGAYPAGSTFKPVTAYAALASGARQEYTPWLDEGEYFLESCKVEKAAWCRFQNAGGAALGEVDLRSALARSSDTYFYSLGEKFWIQPDAYGETAIQEVAELMGYGSPTGIRLPFEEDGRVPTSKNMLEEFGEDSNPWTTGSNVNLAIGQGDLLVTPLQIANAYAMLVTGGDRYQPKLVDRATTAEGKTTTKFDPVQVADKADETLDPALLVPILDGLYNVPRFKFDGVNDGTAATGFAGFPLNEINLGGKTGTAQVTGKADYALYAGFGPRESPKYSVVAILEESGFGGDAAAPAVRRFFEVLYGITETPTAPVTHEARYEQTAPTIDAVTEQDSTEQDDSVQDGAEASEDRDDSSEGTSSESTSGESTSSTVETTVEATQPGSTTTIPDDPDTTTTVPEAETGITSTTSAVTETSAADPSPTSTAAPNEESTEAGADP